MPSAKRQPASPGRSPSAGHPLVSAGWLIRALAAAIVAAALCGYLTICLLFYQGQWQVVFHPSRSITTTPASLGVAFDDVRFDYSEAGEAQLDGWWIPAANLVSNRQEQTNPVQTILFLHGADGSLSDVAAELKELHSLGVNLFAIDYRGFGVSMNTHPSEQHVYEDADAAIAYLTDVRHVDARSIAVYGAGLGATVAAETARRHPECPALILDGPIPPALALIERDRRTGLLPVRLLFHDRFEIAPTLQALRTPKLFLQSAGAEKTGIEANYFPAAAEPKTLVVLNGPPAARLADPKYLDAVRRFLHL